MQLISKYNKIVIFLLIVIDIHSKFALDVPLKDKKGITINNTFQKALDKSKRKPNKTWVDKGSEFYNRIIKLWSQGNGIEIYSTYNEKNLLSLKHLLEP